MRTAMIAAAIGSVIAAANGLASTALPVKVTGWDVLMELAKNLPMIIAAIGSVLSALYSARAVRQANKTEADIKEVHTLVNSNFTKVSKQLGVALGEIAFLKGDSTVNAEDAPTEPEYHGTEKRATKKK